jgi:hypothetical protein
MNNPVARNAWIALWAALAVALSSAGCEKSSSPEQSDPSAAARGATTEDAAVYETPDALLDHIRSLPPTGDGRLALYALIEPRSVTDEMTVRFLRNVDAAVLRYTRAMNDVFGNGAEIEPTDLGMPQWLEELKSAGTPRIDKRYAHIEYRSASGESKSLVLVRAGGSWHVAAATLRGGVAPDDRWAAGEQGRWGAMIRHHRDMAAEVRAGAFATADEARAELQRRLQLPAPQMPNVELND